MHHNHWVQSINTCLATPTVPSMIGREWDIFQLTFYNSVLILITCPFLEISSTSKADLHKFSWHGTGRECNHFTTGRSITGMRT